MGSEAWAKPAMEPVISASTRIYALQPPHFKIFTDFRDWETVMFVSRQDRLTDTYLQEVMDLVEISELVPASYRDERLMWTNHASLKNMI